MAQYKVGGFGGKAIQISSGGDNTLPRIAPLVSNSFGVTWTNEFSAGRKAALIREIDFLSMSLGNIVHVNNDNKADTLNSTIVNYDYDNGKYVVLWVKEGDLGKDAHDVKNDIYAQSYLQGHTTPEATKRLHHKHGHAQYNPEIAKISKDKVAVVWNRDKNPDSSKEIYGEIVEIHKSSNDIKEKSDLKFSVESSSTQEYPRVAAFLDGSFVVSWTEKHQEANKLRAQIYKNDGKSLVDSFQVNAVDSISSYDQSMSTSQSGHLLISWTYDAHNGTGQNVFAQIFDSKGVKLGNELQINSVLENNQFDSRVLNIDKDTFVVSWLSDGAHPGVYIQYISVNGARINTECNVVKDYNVSNDGYDISLSSNGHLILVWSQGQSSKEIFLGGGSFGLLCEQTPTMTKSDSVTNSNSKSNSQSKSKSASNTDTHSLTKSTSGTKSDSKSLSSSDSASVTHTASETESATFSSTDSKTATISQSLSESVSASKSRTGSESVSPSKSHSLSHTDSRSHSATPSPTVSSSISHPISASATESLICGAQVASVNFVFDDFKVRSINFTPAKKYDVTSTITLKNSFVRKSVQKPTLVIDHEMKDFINPFHQYIQENDYVINGSVSYRNQCSNDVLIKSNANIFNTQKTGFYDQNHISYDWFFKDPLRNYCISKWNVSHVEHKIDVPLDPGQCVVAKMKASFYQDIEVPYEARASFTAIDKFGNRMKTDALISAARCIINEDITWKLVEDKTKVEFNAVGIIKHNDLNDVNVELSECPDANIPMVRVSLNYRDFNLQPPQDLTSYDTTLKSSKRFVNTKEYGITDFEASLPLNVKLFNTMNSFHEDIASNDKVLTGKVTYAREYTKHSELLHTETVTGYKVDTTNSQDLEFDWFTSKKTLTTNILSQWDSINLEEKVKTSLAPNKCADAQVVASLYKDVPVPYTAKGYVTMTDIEGYPVLGSKLIAAATRVFNKPVTLGKNNEITFDVNGVVNHNILHKVETAVTDCTIPSDLQSATKIDRVHVSLNYKDFNLQPPQDLTSYDTTLKSSKRFVNTKEHGIIDFDGSLPLNVKLLNSMNSFHEDILSSDKVLSGKVSYLREYTQHNQLLHTDTITGYKVDATKSNDLEFDWFTSKKTLTTNILSPWDSINLEEKVKLSLAPNKCANAQVIASLYKDVPVPYTAMGYVTMTDIEGNPLLGDKLVVAATSIFNKPVTLGNNNEVTFNVNGIFNHNILHKVETAVADCITPSDLQSATKLPMAHASLSYRDFQLTIPQSFEQNAQTVSSTKKIVNKKKYGSVEYKVPLSLEIKLPQSLNSFYQDIKPNDIVLDGEVHYLRKFDDIQFLVKKELSGYKLSSNANDEITHSWFTSQSKVSSSMLSQWDKVQVENEVVLTAVPQQCINMTMTATLYKDVEIFYTATGYFTAKTEQEYPIQGEELVAIAQNIFNKDVELNSKGEVTFETTGTLIHTIVGNIETQVQDC